MPDDDGKCPKCGDRMCVGVYWRHRIGSAGCLSRQLAQSQAENGRLRARKHYCAVREGKMFDRAQKAEGDNATLRQRVEAAEEDAEKWRDTLRRLREPLPGFGEDEDEAERENSDATE